MSIAGSTSMVGKHLASAFLRQLLQPKEINPGHPKKESRRSRRGVARPSATASESGHYRVKSAGDSQNLGFVVGAEHQPAGNRRTPFLTRR
jgi:hypothetical protein